ncbi:DUF3108 domain-containing protein [Reichenbachiella ulvae]|uniref:DUF3108 domain-containing protein n=1 Tax=Reichenbachiella ulvae TaxID=2980104 RepID=A0ABT3CUL1_9BACT|nr:DUF3108 domain-containing protein [Reichenbachiella ulvae]MCV9387248.1 DUF3108 domain-containing protein [Reichenbachiella ulvae]
MKNRMDKPEQFSFGYFPVYMARLAIMLLILAGNCLVNAQSNRKVPKHHFETGEELIYSMHYGWFTIGKATILMDQELWNIQGKPHYYLQCRIQTTGVFDFFSSVDVCAESWIDVATLRPTISYRQFFIGQSMDIRTDRFEYADSVTISTYVEDVNRHQVAKVNISDTLVLDLLSTYLNLRDIVYSNDGSDTTMVKMHFSNDIYPFGIVHSGMEDEYYRFDLIFPETEEYEKGSPAYLLAKKEDTIIPVKLVVELTLGKLVFILNKRNYY